MKNRFKKGDVVVVIFHDHGSRYLAKMFNDDWMREKGYLDKSGLTAKELVKNSKIQELITIESNKTINDAIKLMGSMDISQIPVTNDKRIVGSISEAHLFKMVTKNPDIRNQPLQSIMQPAFPFADSTTPVDSLAQMLTAENPAVLVKDFKTDQTYIITRFDIINALA